MTLYNHTLVESKFLFKLKHSLVMWASSLLTNMNITLTYFNYEHSYEGYGKAMLFPEEPVCKILNTIVSSQSASSVFL